MERAVFVYIQINGVYVGVAALFVVVFCGHYDAPHSMGVVLCICHFSGCVHLLGAPPPPNPPLSFHKEGEILDPKWPFVLKREFLYY